MNDSLITIVIPQYKFVHLNYILNIHRDFIDRLEMPDIIKDSLIKDVHTIRTIINTGKKEGGKDG
jgi:hypothetical protein